MARLTWWVRLAAALLWMGGCVITSGPQPDPPTHTPDAASMSAGCSCGEGPSAPTVVLSDDLSASTPEGGNVTIRGGAGAVEPAGARVTGLNLETTDPPVTVVSREDGSFELSLAGEATDELRLAAQVDRDRSWPVDLLGSGDPVVPERPLPECLWIEPDIVAWLGETVVDGAAAARIAISNLCEEPVTLRVSLRAPPGGPFSLGEGAPVDESVTVEADEDYFVPLELTPAAEGWADDVLFIELESPESLRWPISLWGRAVP